MIANVMFTTTRRQAIRWTACLTAAIPAMVAAEQTRIARLMVTISVNAIAMLTISRHQAIRQTVCLSTTV